MNVSGILFLSILIVSGPREFLREDPNTSGVGTHCYEFREESDTPAPRGFKPVYISHYGRHGSRSDTKCSHYYDSVRVWLSRAKEAGILTDSGDSLLSETEAVIKAFDGMDGRLTRRGEEEHKELARRIYSRYTPVFKKGSKYVRVECSTVPRCIVSMACFTNELTSLQPDLEYTMDCGEKYFAYINNTAPKSLRAKVKVYTDSLERILPEDTVSILSRLFKDPLAGRAIVGSAKELQRSIWYTATTAKPLGVEADIARFIPEDALYKYWDISNREMYMRHCNSVEFGAERMPLTEPLLDVIMTQADEALKSGKVAADLKFGHDHPILALCSYLGLEGVGDRLNFDEIPDKWNDPMNIPLASNLQIVFYRNRRDEVLVKFVYNGVERKVNGLEPVSGPYYRWNDVKTKFSGKTDTSEADKIAFRTADWQWKDLGNGIQCGHAQMNIFNSVQSIAILRYKAGRAVTGIANDSADAADSTSAIALRHKARAAVNGSYFNMKTLYPTTFIKDDGVQEGWTRPAELSRVDGVFCTDGKKAAIFYCDTLSYLAKTAGYPDVMAGGPVLLLNGKEVKDSWPETGFYQKRHPRTLVGIAPGGWIYLVVIDGRFPGQGIGTTIHETAEIAGMLGLKDAINMDGGGSSVLWTAKYGVLSHPYDNRRFDPYGQRTVPNVIYVLFGRNK